MHVIERLEVLGLWCLTNQRSPGFLVIHLLPSFLLWFFHKSWIDIFLLILILVYIYGCKFLVYFMFNIVHHNSWRYWLRMRLPLLLLNTSNNRFSLFDCMIGLPLWLSHLLLWHLILKHFFIY